MTSSTGAKAYGASGANNSAAVGQTANGNKYAAANGNTYSNTGSGWKGSSSNTPKYNTSSYSRPRRAVQLQVAGEGRKRAADHRPSTAEAEAGNPGRQVLVAQKAGAVAVVGEAAGEPSGAMARENNFGERRR